MHYLTQSEQISNQIWLANSDQQVAGIMLQLMPDNKPQQQEEFWEYALAMGQTLRDHELLTLANPVLLQRLYHETDLRIFASRPIHFECSCSENKMKDVIVMLGEADVEQLVQEQGKIEINCDFCNQRFEFDAVDTKALFHPKSIRQHESLHSDIEIVKEIK